MTAGDSGAHPLLRTLVGFDAGWSVVGRPGLGTGGWLYAAGGVNGRVLLTHQGKCRARVTGDVIAARARGEVADPPAWSR